MGIKDELSAFDRELSMFPVRAFDFVNAGNVVIEQDVADVGTVVWDAEVILAHYLDVKYGFGLRGRRVVELGAGTGLAGIVAARLGATVVLTDQAKILPALTTNARANAPELELQNDHESNSDNSKNGNSSSNSNYRDAVWNSAYVSPPQPPANAATTATPAPAIMVSTSEPSSGGLVPSHLANPPKTAAHGTSPLICAPRTATCSGQDVQTCTNHGSSSRSASYGCSSSRKDSISRSSSSSSGGGGCGDSKTSISSIGKNGSSVDKSSSSSVGESGSVGAESSGRSGTTSSSNSNGGGDVVGDSDGERAVRVVGGTGGSWRVKELLFSEQHARKFLVEESSACLDSNGTTDGGSSSSNNNSGSNKQTFDLVVAADVVYLRELWDAMAFTIKILLHPEGEAVMSFEQRRGNVDGFFGLPRFGAARQFPEQRNKRAVSSGDRKEDAEDEVAVGVEIDERRSFEADDEARVGVNRAEVHESRRSNAEIVAPASDAEKENIVVAEGDQYSNVEKHDGKPRRARAEAGEEGTKVVDGEIGEDEKDEEGGRSKKEKATGAEHAQDSRCHRYGDDFCPNTVHDPDGGDRWGTAEISIHQETGGQLGQGAAAAKVRVFRMVQQRPIEIGEERKDLSDGGQLRYARRR